MEPDLILILQLKQGSEDAFEEFIRKYYGTILKYCYFHCRDRSCAEDLTQETFLRFFEHLHDYHHIGKLKNYLYTIARNLCITHSGKQTELPLAGETGVGEDPREYLEEQLLLDAAVRKLPEEFREVVVLHYYQDLKLSQVADILKIGLPLVKYRLSRAKELLRKEIQDE